MKWNVEVLLHLKIEYAMKDKIYTEIQVHFQNMHFNENENFILEKKNIMKNHSWHQYSALGEEKRA